MKRAAIDAVRVEGRIGSYTCGSDLPTMPTRLCFTWNMRERERSVGQWAREGPGSSGRPAVPVPTTEARTLAGLGPRVVFHVKRRSVQSVVGHCRLRMWAIAGSGRPILGASARDAPWVLPTEARSLVVSGSRFGRGSARGAVDCAVARSRTASK